MKIVIIFCSCGALNGGDREEEFDNIKDAVAELDEHEGVGSHTDESLHSITIDGIYVDEAYLRSLNS